MKQRIERVGIVGAGAMGAVYASLLYDMDPGSVFFVARGSRLERLRREPLVVNQKPYRIDVLSPDEHAEPADFIIVAVKNHHLDEAIRDMGFCVGPETIILSVMNGIDSEERIAAAYGKEKVLYSAAVGIDALREGNRITYTTQGKLIFGEAANPFLTETVKRVQELFDRAGIIYETPPDMLRILWWKFMINVGINQASALLGAPYRVFQTSKDARDLMVSAMREVILLGRKVGINLSEEDIAAFDPYLSRLNPEGRTSMLQDVEAGRKTEVEMFAGKVIALGKQYNVPVPVNQMLFDRIRAIESANRASGNPDR